MLSLMYVCVYNCVHVGEALCVSIFSLASKYVIGFSGV